MQTNIVLWLAETVLVFTKEAFHVLTSAGKKGAQPVMSDNLRVAQCASALCATQHLMRCYIHTPPASHKLRGHCLASTSNFLWCLLVWHLALM